MWSPGPCLPTVFRSAIHDCLSLNGFGPSARALRAVPPLLSQGGREELAVEVRPSSTPCGSEKFLNRYCD
jgi:hypothetical protein